MKVKVLQKKTKKNIKNTATSGAGAPSVSTAKRSTAAEKKSKGRGTRGVLMPEKLAMANEFLGGLTIPV